MTQAFPPIDELLPHRGTMLLLDRVFSENEKSIVAGTTVPEAAWYLDEQGGMPVWIGIELMAQAIAAHAALQGRLKGAPPKRGVLLGCRSYRASMPRAAAGALLKVSAKMTLRDESGFGAYDCTIESDSAEFAAATLKVFEPEDFEAFVKQEGNPGGGA